MKTRRGSKRTLFVFLAALVAVWPVLKPEPAPAASGGDAVKLVVTVKEVLLKDKAGNWFTLTDKDHEIDLTVDPPEFTVENQGRVPEGDYVNFRLVLSETVKVAGAVGAHRTRQGGVLRIGGSASTASEMESMDVTAFEQTASTWSKDGAPGEITETLDFDFEDRDDISEIKSDAGFSKPLPIKEKSSVTIRLGMEVRDVMHYAGVDYFAGISSDKAVYFLPPSRVTEVSFKSEGNNRLVTAENLEWRF